MIVELSESRLGRMRNSAKLGIGSAELIAESEITKNPWGFAVDPDPDCLGSNPSSTTFQLCDLGLAVNLSVP